VTIESEKRLDLFERYLTLRVGLCMVVGVAIGKLLPGLVDSLRSLELGTGSQVNVSMAILIWLMIFPMMMKVDFSSVRTVGKRPGWSRCRSCSRPAPSATEPGTGSLQMRER